MRGVVGGDQPTRSNATASTAATYDLRAPGSSHRQRLARPIPTFAARHGRPQLGAGWGDPDMER